MQLTGTGGKRKHVVELEQKGEVRTMALDGQPIDADAVQIAPNAISVMIGGQSFEIHVSRSTDGTLKLQCGPHEFSADIIDPRAWRGRKHGRSEEHTSELQPPDHLVCRLLLEKKKNQRAN